MMDRFNSIETTRRDGNMSIGSIDDDAKDLPEVSMPVTGTNHSSRHFLHVLFANHQEEAVICGCFGSDHAAVMPSEGVCLHSM